MVKTYVVALVMGNQELFTELKNFMLLLRYGSSKLATTRGFSGICMGKSPNLVPQFKSVITFSRHWVVHWTPYMVFLEDMGTIYEITEGILEKKNFLPFFGYIWIKILSIFQFLGKFGPKNSQIGGWWSKNHSITFQRLAYID